jgi:hypothetical protein
MNLTREERIQVWLKVDFRDGAHELKTACRQEHGDGAMYKWLPPAMGLLQRIQMCRLLQVVKRLGCR